MLGGAGSPGGDELLTVTIVRDDQGYGMKVSGDNPVYVQSVKEHGAAWRAGLRSGDRILRVDAVPVLHHTHQQVVHMIRANPTTVLTVQQNSSRHKTPITAPVPVNSEKQRQLEVSKVHTMRLMLEKEQKYIRDLRNELLKVPDMRKQVELESAEQRCSTLQHGIDIIMAGQPTEPHHAAPPTPTPTTPRPNTRTKTNLDKSPAPNTGFLSGLPRSLSNLTGQSLRNLRQARQSRNQQENQPPLLRQNSDESSKRRHNNTVPMVPTTCLDNVTPPPLPPRSIERPRNPLSPNLTPGPVNPLAKPKPCNSQKYYKGRLYPDKPQYPMHQSMPAYDDNQRQFRRSSHSLDGELDGPQPNSIALQMSYPLVNVPPPPLQTDNRTGVPVLHMRSRSSPEQMDHMMTRSGMVIHSGVATPQPLHPHLAPMPSPTPSPAVPPSMLTPMLAPMPAPLSSPHKEWCERDTPPPGTPPPPYATNTQPCADPQRAIISMEEDDAPGSDSSTYSGLFCNLRTVRESKARTAVLLNWLLGERRSPCASLVLVLTDGYRCAAAVPTPTLRRWAYEIHSTFLMPNAVLQLNGVDENMANEIEHVLVNEYDKEELLRNVFRKARQKAKEELGQQLTEFQVKRQVGLATLYGPDDGQLEKCTLDKALELVVVEQLMCSRLRSVVSSGTGSGTDAHGTLLAALIAAALCLHCSVSEMVNYTEISEVDAREVRKHWWQSPRSKKKAKLAKPASVAAAVGGSRASFLQRDKLYKQRLKQIAKQHPQPLVVRGHHLQLVALTSVGHCHHCDYVIGGIAPQAYLCTDCKLRVHRECARRVEEGCCGALDDKDKDRDREREREREREHNRISRFMDRIHNAQPGLDTNDKKSKKTLANSHFLNMERSTRKAEDDTSWEQTLTASAHERRDESDESLYESADGHSDTISASDDALPRLGKTPTISKESLKLAVTDEEVEIRKKTHRKTMSLSNPLEIVRNLGDEWFDSAKKDLDRNSDKKKSRESLWSEEDRDSIHGSTMRLDQTRKNSKKEDKSQSNSRKSSTTDAPKTRKSSKGSSVSALNFLRRKKTPTSTVKPVEAVAEDVVDAVVQKSIITDEILNFTKLFLEGEKLHASISECKPLVETDSEDEPPTPKQLSEHRRRLSRQTSRSKSKVRGKSQSLKVNTLRKSHSGTLKKGKKKSVKTPSVGRSRQASIVEQTPLVKKKHSESMKQNSWLFSGSRGESRREGSNDDPSALDGDFDTSDANKEPDKDNSRGAGAAGAAGARGVNRAESCRERDAPRRGKHRNASDPNRLTAHNNHDLEPGAATAPSGSSSSSSLSSRSNESNTVAAEHQASQSDLSEEDEPLAAQWADSLPAHVIDSLVLCPRLRKRQEVIHELIASEGSHVRWLKVLGGVFLRALETQPGLLPSEELRALFPNLPAVRERHARLYSDLRAVRNEAKDYVVQIRPIADAVLNTLGEPGYAGCLSHFCSRQRMALEGLRERRRKHKELHQFLAAREQLPLCGRLQLRDLLACVWQRLTKYQLLLEGILKTVSDGESEKEEDVARLRRAHDVARDVLHAVDGAIRAAENEHRLRTIQSKLEVRVPTSGSLGSSSSGSGSGSGSGGEWEEVRRVAGDLPNRALRMEGDLAIRNNDSNKKINVLALMLSEHLILLQREGDKFVLKPIAQNHPVPLSPLIKWDKVIFRPNAAVRNTFFLVHINGVQMHELSANTAQEYSTWVRHIQEAPLANLAELKPISHQHRPAPDTAATGTNVSRNPSDASEKSSSNEEPESEQDRTSVERTSTEREKDDTSREEPTAPEVDNTKEEKEERKEENKETEVDDREDKHKARRPTVGRISTHGTEPAAAPLEPSAALTVHAPAALHLAHTAHRAYTHQERLRQLDAVISRALVAKSSVVAKLLGVPPHSFTQVSELAVAEALGHVDIRKELRSTALPRSDSTEDEAGPTVSDAGTEPDIHQLLLAAHTQVNQLTEILRGALRVNEAGAVMARAGSARAGRCDSCRARASLVRGTAVCSTDIDAPEPPGPPVLSDSKLLESVYESSLEQASFDMLDELELMEEQPSDQHLDGDAQLPLAGVTEPEAVRSWDGVDGVDVLSRVCAALGVLEGVSGSLSALVGSVPSLLGERAALRDRLAGLRDRDDALRDRRTRHHTHETEYQTMEDISFQKDDLDPSIQERPSNGG